MDEANKPSLPDLAYCPWCRGNPKMTETHKDHWHVQCESCGARRESSFHNQYIAADSWNSRAGDRQPTMPETVGVKALASATGSAASSKEPERDESDTAPYWLCYAMAEYLDNYSVCERWADGGDECNESSDCITEWCAPCAAKAWLREEERLSAPLPPNVEFRNAASGAPGLDGGVQ